MELTQFFRNIIKDNYLHASWLNSLSYLEYRGFRKIARSQNTADITNETLQHIQEEVRHALFLKNLAMKVGGEKFINYAKDNMLAMDALKKYFYDLDTEISSKTSDDKYQAVSHTVEVRAMEIYHAYEKVLKESNLGISIQLIIGDEEKHLNHFSKKVNIENKDRFREIEEHCFNTMWEQISQ